MQLKSINTKKERKNKSKSLQKNNHIAKKKRVEKRYKTGAKKQKTKKEMAIINPLISVITFLFVCFRFLNSS